MPRRCAAPPHRGNSRKAGAATTRGGGCAAPAHVLACPATPPRLLEPAGIRNHSVWVMPLRRAATTVMSTEPWSWEIHDERRSGEVAVRVRDDQPLLFRADHDRPRVFDGAVADRVVSQQEGRVPTADQ